MKNNKELRYLLSKGSAYCSKSEKCISETKTYLLKFSDNESLIEEVIKILVSENYIDEQRYANAFSNDKFKFSGWGKVKISYMLKQKNISSEKIANSLDFIDDDKYFESVKTLLSKKAKTLKNKDSEQLKISLIRFATGRGFAYDIVYKAIELLKI